MFHPKRGSQEGFAFIIAEMLNPDFYLELGIRHGHTIRMISQRTDTKRCIGVDVLVPKHWPNDEQFYEFYHNSTDDFFAAIKDKILEFPPFDMVFIDAEHTAAAVRKDFHNVFPYVADQGIILLHDGYPTSGMSKPNKCADVYQAIEELRTESCEKGEFEIMTIPHPPGLTLVRKTKKQLPWETRYDTSSK